ncbi:hypothetical protein R6Q59_025107 [Mikania micrantha]
MNQVDRYSLMDVILWEEQGHRYALFNSDCAQVDEIILKEQMKNYKSSENESALVDPFMIVMDKENSGTVDFMVEVLLTY